MITYIGMFIDASNSDPLTDEQKADLEMKLQSVVEEAGLAVTGWDWEE